MWGDVNILKNGEGSSRFVRLGKMDSQNIMEKMLKGGCIWLNNSLTLIMWLKKTKSR